MKSYAPRLSIVFLVVAAASVLACSSPPNLRSISVIPQTTDAESYPGGQVQFAATGYFSSSSTPEPVQVTWGTCSNSGPSEITVSAQGVAQCNPGASGTYVVEASVPLNASGVHCQLVNACGEAGADCLATHGVAKLTCP
jgi:hypothetical protein